MSPAPGRPFTNPSPKPPQRKSANRRAHFHSLVRRRKPESRGLGQELVFLGLSPANRAAGLVEPTCVPRKELTLAIAVGSGFKPDLGWRPTRQRLELDHPSANITLLPRKRAPHPRTEPSPRMDAQRQTKFGPSGPRLKLSRKAVAVLESRLPLGFVFRRPPTCPQR